MPRWLWGVLLWGLASGSALADRKAVVVLADHLTWADVMAGQTPELRRLIAEGSVAALSCQAARPRTRDAYYLSLGAGSRALAPSEWSLRPGATNLAAGDFPPRGARFEGMDALRAAQRRLRYDIQVGSLGSAIRQAGLKVGIIGCGAELVAVDAGGGVDCRLPADQVDEALACCDLLVADVTSAATGDAQPLRPDQGAQYAERVDEQVGRVLAQRSPEWLVACLSPSPGPARPAELTFCVVAGPGFPRGLLVSATTQRPGLITNLDLAPTLLRYFDLTPPGGYSGRRLRSVPRTERAVLRLPTFCRRITQAERFRFLLLPLWGQAVILTIVGGWAGVLWRRRRRASGPPRAMPDWAQSVGTAWLLGSVSVPAVAVVAPLLVGAGAGPWPELGVVVAGVAVVVWAARRLAGGPSAAVRAVALATVGLLAADVLTGAHLQLYHPLGYSALEGGRFYGLGGESTAVLLGMALLAHAFWPQSAKGGKGTPGDVLLPAFWVALIILAGHPSLGAKAGGTLTVAGTGCLALLSRRSGRLCWWHLPVAGAVAVGALAAFVVLDRLRGADVETHLGHATGAIRAGGWHVAAAIVVRKLCMSFGILTYNAWSLLCVPVCLALLVALLSPHSPLRREIAAASPGLDSVLPVAALGGLGGALTNDSGVAILGLMWAVILLAGLYVVLEQDTPEG